MLSVRKALSAYVADREPVVASEQRLHSTTRPLLRHLGRLDAAALTREVLIGYTRRRVAEGVQPQTARRELITLRAALRLAWRDGRLERVPPIPMPSPGQPRQRVLASVEIERLRRAVADDPPMQLFVALLLGTGARKGAVLELTWDRVDLATRQIDYRAPHPRAARRKHRAVVPMPARLAALLRRHRQRAAAGDRVIRLSCWTVERRFRAACRRARLPGVTPHVLRHTVATHLLRRVKLVEASRMLGHRSVSITEQIYGHLTVEDIAPAAKALNALL